MRKALLLSTVLTCAGLCASAAVAPYDAEAALTSARADVANWMKYLPDDMFAAHVSIPGTHDTATGEKWISTLGASMSTTQEAKLGEQLEAGVRAFDFRPGLYQNELYCSHGSTHTELKMKDAMKIITDFLDAHPDEFLVFHFFRGNIYRLGDNSSATLDLCEQYDALINELFNEGWLADYIIDYNPMLKVGDMRGKIVMFRRDRIDFAHFNKAANLTGWPSDTDPWNANTYATASNADNLSISGIVQVTDISSPKKEENLNIELSSLTNLYNYTSTQTRPNEVENPKMYRPFWSMLFTSGAYPSENTKGYLTNATHTNPHFTALINDAEKKGPAGIVFSDWVLRDVVTYSNVDYETKGIDLVKAIIENNFAYAADFILDDELFTNEPGTNVSKFENKEYFLRNVATGEYLCAGTTWGTHATAGPVGIRLIPIYDDMFDTYKLATTFGGYVGLAGEEYYVDYGSNADFTVEEAAPGKYYFIMTVDGVKKALTNEPHNQPMFVDGSVNFMNARDYQEGNTMQQWEMVSADDILADAVAQASDENPVDVTFMIRGHRLNANDKDNNVWSLRSKGSSAKYDAGTAIDTWNDKDIIARIYSTSATPKYNAFVSRQTINGLPAGRYSFSANYATSTADIPLSVGDVKPDLTKAVQSSTSLTVAQALALFKGENKDNYIVKADGVKVGDDGVLEIKIDNTEGIASKYSICFDNLKLYYHGKSVDDGAGIDETIADENAPVEYFNLQGMRVENPANGLYIKRQGATATKVLIK